MFTPQDHASGVRTNCRAGSDSALRSPALLRSTSNVLSAMKLLGRLRDELGIAFVFIAHDLPVVRDFADRVFVMRKGEIVEQGMVRGIFDSPQTGYTQRLLAAGLDPDPEVQRQRREARLALASAPTLTLGSQASARNPG